MTENKHTVDDLIEETRLRHLSDEQVEWRLRKFTEICEQAIKEHVQDSRKRKMLAERLEILKYLYNHSSVKHSGGGLTAREAEELKRNMRLQNIVRRRRMALEMIHRSDPQLADLIERNLEKAFAGPGHPADFPATISKGPDLRSGLPGYSHLSSNHWYFFYFNLFLLASLAATVLIVVK
ncbi:MAG: hypothetical protein U9N45_06025 [Gemmatimonadota bacterium]|nr:hypothetical protein [Gemmatimonadota bacterium]